MAHYCPHRVTPNAHALRNTVEDGMFGRMFPQLAAALFDQALDLALAETGDRIGKVGASGTE